MLAHKQQPNENANAIAANDTNQRTYRSEQLCVSGSISRRSFCRRDSLPLPTASLVVRLGVSEQVFASVLFWQRSNPLRFALLSGRSQSLRFPLPAYSSALSIRKSGPKSRAAADTCEQSNAVRLERGPRLRRRSFPALARKRRRIHPASERAFAHNRV